MNLHFPKDWLKKFDDLDEPEGCPHCGAIAGACKDYPNCPGGSPSSSDANGGAKPWRGGVVTKDRLEQAERLIREVLESGRLVDSLWEIAALEWVGDDKVYCACANPDWKVWTNGTTYCTHCGWHQRPTSNIGGK